MFDEARSVQEVLKMECTQVVIEDEMTESRWES